MTSPTITHVHLTTFRGEPLFLSIERFMAISPPTRARLIAGGAVELLTREGATVSAHEALGALSSTSEAPSAAPVDDERREHARFAYVRPVTVAGRPGVSCNVSRGGMLLRAREGASPGARVEVSWAPRGAEHLPVTRAGVVRRSKTTDPRETYPHVLAIEFVESPAAVLRAA